METPCPGQSTEEVGGTWTVERAAGEAADFHARTLSEPVARRVSVLEVLRPALVLGSTQPDHHADGAALARAGVALVRRRSGGGAVLLVPGESLWVDVVVPRDDPLWDDDVGRAAHWLGRAWQAALHDLGVGGATVHTGALVASRWSSLVCFAGLGPGEVQLDGRKLLGMAQRRNRAGTRFQCTLSRRWEPATLLGLLGLAHEDRARAGEELAAAATGLDLAFPLIVDALLAHLPSR